MDCRVVLFLCGFFFVNGCSAIYLTNTSVAKRSDNPAVWTEDSDGVWGPVLEEWVLGGSHRQGRVMQIPISHHTYIIQDRLDTMEPPKINKYNVGKIVTSPNNSYRPPPPSPYPSPYKPPPPRQIRDTDLYLLSAIEKLVYKVDFMEKRLRKVEEMLYYVMAGNRMDIEPCANNFTRVGQNCYMFAHNAGREYDWKVASKQCKKLGGTLAEMETIEENQDVIAYIQNSSHLTGKDFWVGGLNPGLLWIWSNSARPIVAPGSEKNKDNPSAAIHGDGRCLKLAYNPALRSYAYKGEDCSVRFSYICELPESTSSNEINKIGRSRKIFNEL